MFGKLLIQASISKYKPSEIPSVIAPETGHSYNPREGDVEKLLDRVIDYESIKTNLKKEK